MHSSGYELLNNDEMARADRLAIQSGISGQQLMQNAGQAVADVIQERSEKRPVAVLCGPGNNGGDGFVVASLLKDAGWPVRLAMLGDINALPEDAAFFARKWSGATEPLSLSILEGNPLVIDALFGAGLCRPLTGPVLEMVQTINARDMNVVAIDLPSGLNGSSGQILGDAINATVTVSFFRAKPGHFLYPGRGKCGQLIIRDIGIPDSVLSEIRPQSAENQPGHWNFKYPFPRYDDHKYSRGCGVIWGGEILSGAAILAAHAARRMGCGIVRIAVPENSLGRYLNSSPGDIVTPWSCLQDGLDTLKDKRVTAVLLGPGAGVNDNTKKAVLSVLESQKPVVLDADALTVFKDSPGELFTHCHAFTVLTPHHGEFERLFPDLSGSKVERAGQAAKMTNATLLFKGADTVIAAPDGRTLINSNAPPWLATAGSGDVLAGMISALMAQGLQAFDSAAIACWMHSQCAINFGPGLIAEDIAGEIPGILKAEFL